MRNVKCASIHWIGHNLNTKVKNEIRKKWKWNFMLRLLRSVCDIHVFCVFFYGSIFIPAHVPLNISFTPSSTVPVFYFIPLFRGKIVAYRSAAGACVAKNTVTSGNSKSWEPPKHKTNQDKAGNTQILIVYHAVNANQQDSKSGCCSSKEFIKIITMGIGGTREPSFAPLEEGTNARMDRKYQSLLAGGRSKSGEIWKI